LTNPFHTQQQSIGSQQERGEPKANKSLDELLGEVASHNNSHNNSPPARPPQRAAQRERAQQLAAHRPNQRLEGRDTQVT